MTQLPDLTGLSHDEKDALIRALWAQVQALTAQVQTLTARVAELEAKLGEPPKTPDNSSRCRRRRARSPTGADKPKREGPRRGSLGAKAAGGRWRQNPDETVIARPVCCAHCQAALRRRRSHAGRPLRQDRSAEGQAGGHAGGAICRALPVLRPDHAGAAAGGPGAGHAVQPQHRGAGDVSALHPCRSATDGCAA